MHRGNTRAIKWNLIKKRVIKHHFPIFILSGIAIAGIYSTFKSEDTIWLISMSTAYPALVLLSLTLLTSPWKLLRGKPNPVSDDLTRDIGIWAAIIGLIHTIFGLQVHFRGTMWQLFFHEEINFPNIRFDLFGTANYTGLIAACILVILLAISNNRSLRKLGASTWKQMQRSNYVLFFLVIIHSIIYMVLENRDLGFVLFFAGTVLTVLVVQAKGFSYYKRNI